jgi:hypothetical protein
MHMQMRYTIRALIVVVGTSLGASAANGEDVQVGSQSVDVEDMVVVQIHCSNLLDETTESSGAGIAPGFSASGGSTGPQGGEVAGDPAGSSTLSFDGGNDGGAGVTLGAEDAPDVDLADITLDDCREANLIR